MFLRDICVKVDPYFYTNVILEHPRKMNNTPLGITNNMCIKYKLWVSSRFYIHYYIIKLYLD